MSTEVILETTNYYCDQKQNASKAQKEHRRIVRAEPPKEVTLRCHGEIIS
jgi:hypothetical protein